MNLKQLSAGFSVSPQLRPEDLTILASQGVRAIINNRPDGEEAGQPGDAVMRAAAEKAGLAYAHLPVTPGQQPAPDLVRRFADVLGTLPGPVVAYCRSGARSASLWTLSQGPARS